MSMLFKFLDEEGRAYHGGSGAWPLPRGDRPGKWLKVEGEIRPCANGLHLCTAEHLLRWAAPALYVAEAGKVRVDNGDKIVVQRARLIRRVDEWNDKNLRLFAADCAERALRRERKARREPDKRSWDAVRVAREFACGKATMSERAAARDAAWVAAGDAAWDAAWAAAGAAARDAAWAAAGDAAWDAARDAAGAAAWDAAGDAEREWQMKRLLRYLNLEASS